VVSSDNAGPSPGDTEPVDASGEIRRVLREVIAGWHWFLLTFITVVVGLLLVIRLWPEQYSASMVVGPVAEVGAAAMGPRVPMMLPDRTAPLAEYGAVGETLSDFSRFLNLLATPVVAERLLESETLIHRLFPARWDAVNARWRSPTGLTGWVRTWALWLVGRQDWVQPDATAVARQLRRMLGMERVAQGPMRRIRIRYADRETALALLGAIYRAADRHLRDEAARRARLQLAHVERRLETVRVAANRQALGMVRGEYQRLIMMLEVDLPFAADLIEPPNAPQYPEWPDKIALLFLVLPTALVAALLAVFVRIVWRRGG